MDRLSYVCPAYDEALSLVVDARNYLAECVYNGDGATSNKNRLDIAFEHQRLTGRLTVAMSWLLIERAVHNGEMPINRLMLNDYPFSQSEFFTDPSSSGNETLSPRLRQLLDRSHRIYIRVMRLNVMVQQHLTLNGQWSLSQSQNLSM